MQEEFSVVGNEALPLCSPEPVLGVSPTPGADLRVVGVCRWVRWGGLVV